MCKPDQVDETFKDEIFKNNYRSVVAMVRSGAKHECGVKLNQKQCQALEMVLMISIDISRLIDSVSKMIQDTIIIMEKFSMKNEKYSLDAYMRQIKKESEWKDLNIKLKNSMGEGTFIDDNEVMLILTALAHSRGIEHAFKRMFLELCTEKQEAIGALHEDGEQKEKV